MAKTCNIRHNTLENYYSRILKQSSGCWEFQSWQDRDGYRFFRYEGRDWKAHRLAVILDGRDPTGKIVMHKCDNPWCVNPEHLVVGSPKENSADCSSKGRNPGNKKYHSKFSGAGLPDTLIKKIQESSGTRKEIAKMCGVSIDTVRKYKQLKG
jgi:hypothetical protein